MAPKHESVEPEDQDPPPKPTSVRSATKVNVAFPFGVIKVEEPRDELVAVIDLVRDLAEVVRRLEPGDETTSLLERAEALVLTLT
jgi:hypothetical protein